MFKGLTRREFIKTTSLAAFGFFIAGCGGEEQNKLAKADLVVYGKIFTSEDNKIVEAFAVKDGKFIYVGDKAGAEAFIDKNTTEIIDYTDKGLVMPGCGNGHEHYSIGYGIPKAGTIINMEITPEKFLSEIVPEAVKKAKDSGATSVLGLGWDFMKFQHNMPTRQQLDAICNDIPMYFADEEGHKGLANTLALINAGIMAKDGSALKKSDEIRGGEIVMGEDGTPIGYLQEQAGTYTRSFLDNEKLFTVDIAKSTMQEIEQHLLSEGYTMYIDGWGNYFYNENYYKAAQQMDKSGDMHFILGTTYEIESWMDVGEALSKAIEAKKYESTHVKPKWIKIFMDGTVETGTGFIEPLYLDGHQGIANWEEEELTELTRKANENGLTMHIHAMGNKGVNRVVNSYVNGGKSELRNTIVHVHQVFPSDYKRMAENNIYVTEGMIWHCADDEFQAEILKILPAELANKSYPIKFFFDNGVPVSFHTDYPALSNSPDDPFGIMEISLTGVCYFEGGAPWDTDELVTREQALNALTIGCARQMFLENERGSISKGKFADFLLVNKDVLNCPVTEIHEAKPTATYFEGKKVFSA